MKNINVFGAKGGVGTTTVAVATALDLSNTGVRVSIGQAVGVTVDDSISAVCGMGTTGEPGHNVIGNLYLHNPLDDYAEHPSVRTVVRDYGTDIGQAASLTGPGNYNILVVRNEYLGLRRAIKAQARFDGLVLIEEPGRALGLREVIDVLGLPHIVTIPVVPTIARAIDAGVLRSRMPAELSKPVRKIVTATGAATIPA